MNAETIKAFFGCSEVLRTLRQDLKLTPKEQLLACFYATVAICAEADFSKEDATVALGVAFDKNFESAKVAAQVSAEQPPHKPKRTSKKK